MTTPYPIRVFDVRPEEHGSLGTLPRLGEGDLDGLQAFYHFELDYTYGWQRARPGQLFWAITAFELKAGPAVLQPQVRGLDGNPITTPPGVLLFLYWPGAPEFPQGVIPNPPYHDVGIASFTEGNGSVGWGFGPESHIGAEGGPFSVWASSDPPEWPDRRVGSDAVRKLGWWDDHIVPNPIFQVMRKPGGVEPPTGDEYLVYLNADGSVRSHVALVPGPPASGQEALGLWQGGQVTAHAPVTAGAPPVNGVLAGLARIARKLRGR